MLELTSKYPSLVKRSKREPLPAIRLKCLDCMCDSTKEVELCPVKECSLWPFRFGKRPSTARKAGRDV